MPTTTLVFLLLSLALLCVHGHGTECEVLRRELDDQKIKYEAELKSQKTNYEGLKAVTKQLVERVEQMEKQIVEPVAFSAALNNPIEVSEGDVVKFDFEFIDTHGLHNLDVGIVTIPQTGVYEVNVNLYKNTGTVYNQVSADLYVNESALARLYNRYVTDTQATAHGTVMIIHELTIGNTLYVRAGNAGSIYGDGFARSQFNVNIWDKCQRIHKAILIKYIVVQLKAGNKNILILVCLYVYN